MKDKMDISLSKDLYQKFLELKKTVSLMTKGNISDEDLIGFMVQEVSFGLEVMNSRGNGCGGHNHEDIDHKCCGGGKCNDN